MAAMYYKNNSTGSAAIEGSAAIDPPEHLYIIPDQTTVSSTSTTKHSLTTGNNQSPRNSSNTCRIFLIIIASLIIGCAVGCVVMYLWTRQIGTNKTPLEVTRVSQGSAEDSTENPATFSQCAYPTYPIAPAFPTRAYTFHTAVYPLGMGDRSITDQQITGSSSTSQTYAPHKARLHVNLDDHWKVSQDPAPWIQVEFLSNVTIRGIQTQGNQRNRWVKTLQIQTGDSEQTLSYIMDGNTNATFTANSDSSSVATVILPEPICTNYLRIHPISCAAIDGNCGLRFEVLGFTQCFTG